MQTQAAISFENATFVYSPGTPFEKKAVDGVTVSFDAGCVTGIIGHTGSGKSTLASMMNGLIRPTGGTVRHFGTDIWAEPKKIGLLRFRVGLVFQYPEYQLFEETVEKDVAFGPKNMGLSDGEIKDRVRSAISFVGLSPEILAKNPFELSGGQKRRVAVAGVLAMQPDTLVLDEPAAGLDPRGKAEILDGLMRYNKERGATLILISHSMEDMARFCGRLLVMENGAAPMYGTVAEIFSESERLVSMGLDVPQITRLCNELRRRGLPLSGGIYTVQDAYLALRALGSSAK